MDNVLHGLDNEAYHSDRAIGSSGLVLIRQSPAHYWAKYIDPEREPEESTPAQKTGTATHMAILEHEKFSHTYVVVPEGVDRRSNAGKALFKEIEEAGQVPIKPDEMKAITGMANSIHSHRVMRLLMSLEHHVETSIFWNDPVTGVRCKMRPDLYVPPCQQFPNGVIADLKTTTDASPAGFSKQVWNNELFIQSAWYTDGFQQAFGTREPPLFLWLAAEKETPYARQFYACSRKLIEYGRRECSRLLGIYAQCLATDNWPGYSDSVNELELPAWADKIVTETLSS